MRIREAAGDEDSGAINMTPMIDMVFLLLVFFLVATTFAQEEREIQVQLPGSSVSRPLSAPPRQLIVNIMVDGSTKVGGQTLSRQELADILTRMAKNEPDREVLIRADEASLHRYFAGVASLCRQLGINEVRIGYMLEGPKPVKVK